MVFFSFFPEGNGKLQKPAKEGKSKPYLQSCNTALGIPSNFSFHVFESGPFQNGGNVP